MLIQKIELENFGPFFGKTSIDLSVTDQENVILFNGLNDTGKTSFYKAIKFCMYGETSSLQSQKHVNRTRRVNDDGRTSVTLIFQHNEENYQITRSIEFKKTPLNDTLDIQKNEFNVIRNGTPESIQTIEDEKRFIEYILPEEASQFFLFDGEEIQGYTQNPPHPNIKNAIEMLLGIKELLNAVDDLERVKIIQEERVRNELAQVDEYKEEKLILDELAENIKKKDDEISDIELQIINLDEQKSDYENKLRKYAEIKDVIEQKSIAEKDLEKTEQDVSNTLESLRNFNDYELAIWLLTPFLKKFKDYAKPTTDLQLKRIASDVIIKNSCICGRTLDTNSLQNIKDLAEGETITEFQDIHNCASELLDKFGLNLNKDHYLKFVSELNGFKERKNSLEAEINAKISELGAKSKILDSEYNTLQHEYKICSNNLTQRRIMAADMKNKKDEDQRKYDSKYRFLSSKTITKEFEIQNKRLLLIKVILKSINEFIEEIVASRKSEIENIASQFLRDITNAPEVYTGIELDDRYRLHLKIKDQSTIPSWERGPSAGQSQVIAHSFISALNQFTAKEAPIIIDTPLARLDNIHAENIVRSYPAMGKQVIVLYQPRELDERLIGLIKSHIRAEYDIKRDLVDPENSVVTRRER